MKYSLFAAIVAASALGGACFAQGAAGAPGASPAGATTPTPPSANVHKTGYDPDAQICKWTDELGSRLGRTKTCMTRAQWDQVARDSQDDLNDTTQRGREGAPPGS